MGKSHSTVPSPGNPKTSPLLLVRLLLEVHRVDADIGDPSRAGLCEWYDSRGQPRRVDGQGCSVLEDRGTLDPRPRLGDAMPMFLVSKHDSGVRPIIDYS